MLLFSSDVCVHMYEQLVTAWTRHLVTATKCTFQSSSIGVVYIYEVVVTCCRRDWKKGGA